MKRWSRRSRRRGTVDLTKICLHGDEEIESTFEEESPSRRKFAFRHGNEDLHATTQMAICCQWSKNPHLDGDLSTITKMKSWMIKKKSPWMIKKKPPS
jgi:hypothetical protein